MQAVSVSACWGFPEKSGKTVKRLYGFPRENGKKVKRLNGFTVLPFYRFTREREQRPSRRKRWIWATGLERSSG